MTALLDPYCQEGIESCLLMDVRRLLPGHCMVVTSADVKIYRWWHTLDHLVTPPSGLAQQAAHFRELFDDACRLRMRECVSYQLVANALTLTIR